MSAAAHASHRDEETSILGELMTARQLAGVFQVPVSTVEDYARRGILPSIKLGRHRRFLRTQVEKTIVAMAEASYSPAARQVVTRAVAGVPRR
jgi:excisionase family DNA binding protein